MDAVGIDSNRKNLPLPVGIGLVLKNSPPDRKIQDRNLGENLRDNPDNSLGNNPGNNKGNSIGKNPDAYNAQAAKTPIFSAVYSKSNSLRNKLKNRRNLQRTFSRDGFQRRNRRLSRMRTMTPTPS